eukprot:CAMPEP_0175074162 /NCGR_PEP_ID=MMETSP0052_2-20121109/21112_1 /TAXON_ID=51329 ORGANISM="Polytomella parva, Strain SAG 63-3" /NCGR_SAMPLE_ID=MMETSP0052_2 /ASSEMBLY_ACC=CAM_ASM_000194 /LENGTH=327 /DNA_ID=CAMNT_0016342347 /DNA_START=86 /DNA_END=1065 /DNA_ORIENTATION=-
MNSHISNEGRWSITAPLSSAVLFLVQFLLDHDDCRRAFCVSKKAGSSVEDEASAVLIRTGHLGGVAEDRDAEGLSNTSSYASAGIRGVRAIKDTRCPPSPSDPKGGCVISNGHNFPTNNGFLSGKGFGKGFFNASPRSSPNASPARERVGGKGSKPGLSTNLSQLSPSLSSPISSPHSTAPLSPAPDSLSSRTMLSSKATQRLFGIFARVERRWSKNQCAEWLFQMPLPHLLLRPPSPFPNPSPPPPESSNSSPNASSSNPTTSALLTATIASTPPSSTTSVTMRNVESVTFVVSEVWGKVLVGVSWDGSLAIWSLDDVGWCREQPV